MLFFSNSWKGNNLRIISSGHLGDVAGGSGRVKFFYRTDKPLIEMSLAQCCEDQLTPINQTVLNQADSKGEFPLQRLLPFLGRSRPGTGSANNQPLWPCRAWNTSRGCLGWWRKDPFVVLPPAAAGTGCKLFPHLSHWFYVFLEQMWCPGALPPSSLCSSGLCVSRAWSVSAVHEYLLWIKSSSEKQELWGLAAERGAVESYFVGVCLLPLAWKQLTGAITVFLLEICVRGCQENQNLCPWMLKTVIPKISASRPIMIMLFLEFWGRWQ